MVISLTGLILPGLGSRLSLLHQLSAHYMQMTHPNSGTYNVKYINYTDSATKRQRGDMEIFPKDSLSAPEGRAGWAKGREGKRKISEAMQEEEEEMKERVGIITAVNPRVDRCTGRLLNPKEIKLYNDDNHLLL